ncbi:helix-turn-helix domain-containing protein [Paenibacillus macerans]|uniref:RodZ domain-containing protein n=1 Tax=Paenibacillus macerans TaxID=44252 RepID=UPI0022E76D29|nr:RodZ domain-containing protein [Paenibacillus macerans]MEC0135977.1 helix-turn-helix domain-containing protein [Paenibacillus macerans]
MSELGQKLKEARLAKGLSLDDIQEMTKIRKRYLEAIESGDYKVLPGSFYVRAFIKTYAETVGVDADELLAEHRQNVPDAVPEQTMEPVIQKRRSRQHAERNSKWLSTTLMWSFAVLILIVIYMYFTIWGKTNQSAGEKPDPTPVTPATQAEGQGTNGSGNAKNGGQSGPGNHQTGTGDAVNGGSNTGNAGTGSNAGTGANTGAGTGANGGTGTDNTGGTASPQDIVVVPDGKEGSTTKFKVQNAGGQPVQAVITASGESWVEVRKGGRKGDKLYFGKTSDGDVLTYDIAPEGLFILSGASNKTAITVAGQTVEDGKATSRILLTLDDGTGADTGSAGDAGAGGDTSGDNVESVESGNGTSGQ